jgi:polysaccharide biosynthesis/export protein
MSFKMSFNWKHIFIPCLILSLYSCGINRNIMFRELKGSNAVQSDSIPMKPNRDYVISLDDKFSFTLITNNGEKLVTGLPGGGNSVEQKEALHYVIRSNGTADLPLLGSISLAGLTVKECEDTLAKLYAEKGGYIDPYVQVKLLNQRVIVFPGGGSDAKVVNLTNNNTTLMEALALAGGIADRGRADRIKLIRLVDGKRMLYTIDLSTINGLKYTDMIVQTNDYIYVEPTENVASETLEKVTPIVSIFTSALIIFSFINNL